MLKNFLLPKSGEKENTTNDGRVEKKPNLQNQRLRRHRCAFGAGTETLVFSNDIIRLILQKKILFERGTAKDTFYEETATNA